MASRPRLLFVHMAQGERLTGGPRMVHQLVSRLDPERAEAIFVGATPTDLSRALVADGIDVRILPLPSSLDVYGKALARPSLRRGLAAVGGLLAYNRVFARLLRETRPDLIWTGNLRTFLTILPACWWRGVPVVWNIWLGQESRGAVRVMNGIALRRARRIVTEYRGQAAELFTPAQLEHARSKIRTVYTGHAVPALTRNRDGARTGDATFTVGTMGAFSPRKNPGLLLEAARLVRERVPSVRFAFAGEAATPEDEGYAAALRERCRETGLEDAVEWCGWVDPPQDFLRRLDVYVQCSEHEGLPGAVREAMLDGLPVVATRVGGTAEIVVDGETGYLVDRGDTPALADAIVRLASDREAAAALGLAGRRRAEVLFSQESFLAGYREVLEEVLAAD